MINSVCRAPDSDIESLLADLALTRTRGYSVENEEYEAHTCCIAAPVLNELGQVIGSLSVSSANPSPVHEQLNDMAAHVTYTAQETSRRMGYVAPRPSRAADALGPSVLVEAPQWQ